MLVGPPVSESQLRSQSPPVRRRPAARKPPQKRRLGVSLRLVFVGIIAGALAALSVEFARMGLDRNQHTVAPGRVYRAGQFTPDRLARFVRQHQIRTIVNLRGRPFDPWYGLEARATQQLGISQEDVTTSANRLPAPGEIRRLIEIFDRSEYPILLHCQQGADRTGLAAAIYLLLQPQISYADARHQCSPRYGHIPFHSTVAMDDFFDQYKHWLHVRGHSHSPAKFRQWTATEYCPGPGKARLELLEGPTDSNVMEPTAFTVRAYNTSREPWHFRAGTKAGVYVYYVVHRADGTIAYCDRAGLFNRTIPPGGSIDLNLPIPPLLESGQYRLFVDLSVGQSSFTQYGSEPLTHDWDACHPASVGR